MKSDILYWLWYSKLQGITTQVKLKLLENAVSPEYIFKNAAKNLPDYISGEVKHCIQRQATLPALEKYVPIAESSE